MIVRRRLPYLLPLFVLSLAVAHAQSPLSLARPEASADMPEWARFLYVPAPNVYRVDSAYRAYYAGHVYERDRYTRYYRRWRRLNEPFVAADGTLRPPTPEALAARLEERSARAAAQIESAAALPVSANAWKVIGPLETVHYNAGVAQSLPWQVNIYAFDIAPSNPNILYCFTETGGFFKTTDKGATWEFRDVGIASNSEAVEIHPTTPNIVYCGVKDGIIRTTDGGLTWKYVLSKADLWVYDIEVSPTNPTIAVAGTTDGFYRSNDAGSSWSRTMDRSVCDLEMKPNNGDVVTALRLNASTKRYELWKSTDAGLTFSIRSTGWANDVTSDGGGRLAVTPANPARVYAVLLTSGGPRVLRSDDAGDTWRVTAKGGTDSLKMDNGQGYYDLSIMAAPGNADQVIVGTTTAFKSTDGGVTFSVLGGYYGPFPIHPDIQEMKAQGSDAWIATDGGITLSTDFFTKNSEARVRGIWATDLWGFGAGWNQDVLVGGRYHNGNTAIRDSYAGRAYRLGGGEAATGYVNPIECSRTYSSDIGGYIVPDSISGEAEYFPVGKFPNESYYVAEYSEMEWDPRCWNVVWLGNRSTVWRSSNGARSYDSVFALPDTNSWAMHIEISRANPDVIYLSEQSNKLWDGWIWRTTDGGGTWKRLATIPGTSNGERRVMTMTASATDANVLWVGLRDGGAANKVFRTTDGGETWANLTTPKIAGLAVHDILHQYGTDGGVYIGGPSGNIFYRNAAMDDWAVYGAGLPSNFYTRALKPYYRAGKLRAASSMGFWEIPLYEHGRPIAQPTVDKRTTACVRDTFHFDDYSALEYDAQEWSWSFPGASYVSSATVRNPSVLYDAPGEYAVTLTVKNRYGTGTRTVEKMVAVVRNDCAVDTVPGLALNLAGRGNTVAIAPIPGLKNAPGFTLSAWIKLNGKQEWFSQIASSWGSNVGFAFGFAFTGYVPTYNLTFSWRNVPYQLTSPFNIDSGVWTHVAVVVRPDTVTLYRNGVPWSRPGDYSGFDLSSAPFEVGGGVPGQGGDINGEIDEMKFYDRALTTAEIRERMHLIAKDGEPGLVAHYQFNEAVPERFYNRSGATHALNAGAAQAVSTAPVANGHSFRMTVNDGGEKDFTGTGLKLYLPSGGTYPNGEMVASRLAIQPDSLPPLRETFANTYWILQNWGTNQRFSLDSIAFDRLGTLTRSDRDFPAGFKLFTRSPNEHRESWGAAAALGRTADSLHGRVTFGSWGELVSAGQFTVATAGTSVLGVEEPAVPVAADVLSAWPNPCVRECTLGVIARDVEEEGEIVVTDMRGTIVMREEVELMPGRRFLYRLDLGALPAGAYVVELNGRRAVVTKR